MKIRILAWRNLNGNTLIEIIIRKRYVDLCLFKMDYQNVSKFRLV